MIFVELQLFKNCSIIAWKSWCDQMAEFAVISMHVQRTNDKRSPVLMAQRDANNDSDN